MFEKPNDLYPSSRTLLGLDELDLDLKWLLWPAAAQFIALKIIVIHPEIIPD
jgi:hypothetical protein